VTAPTATCNWCHQPVNGRASLNGQSYCRQPRGDDTHGSSCYDKAIHAKNLTRRSLVNPCPECAAGKHGNCDGRSWDLIADQPAPCPCAHPEPHT